MKLTEAQRKVLVASMRRGGVVGFGEKWRVVGPLKKLGLLTPNTENYGYYVATPAGRAALSGGEE